MSEDAKPEPCVCGKPSVGACLDDLKWRGWCGANECRPKPGGRHVPEVPPRHVATSANSSVGKEPRQLGPADFVTGELEFCGCGNPSRGALCRIGSGKLYAWCGAQGCRSDPADEPHQCQCQTCRADLTPLNSWQHTVQISTGIETILTCSDDGCIAWAQQIQDRARAMRELATVGVPIAKSPPLEAWPTIKTRLSDARPDCFDQRQIDEIKAVMLSTTRRGAK